MYKVQYSCDVFDYKTGTWWNCDYDTITQHPRYPLNVYDDLSTNKKMGKMKKVYMGGSDGIVSMLYIKNKLLHLALTLFL